MCKNYIRKELLSIGTESPPPLPFLIRPAGFVTKSWCIINYYSTDLFFR